MNAASTFAAASSCICRSTCEYTFKVKAALVCPRCSDTTFGDTPRVNASAACRIPTFTATTRLAIIRVLMARKAFLAQVMEGSGSDYNRRSHLRLFQQRGSPQSVTQACAEPLPADRETCSFFECSFQGCAKASDELSHVILPVCFLGKIAALAPTGTEII
jgi:hypothetical protein